MERTEAMTELGQFFPRITQLHVVYCHTSEGIVQNTVVLQSQRLRRGRKSLQHTGSQEQIKWRWKGKVYELVKQSFVDGK